MKRRTNQFYLRVILLGCASLLFFGNSALAERPADINVYTYLNQAGPVGFASNNSGAAYLPGSVMNAMKAGQLSPVLQFVLFNHVMNQAIKNAMMRYPYRRDSFATANKKFGDGICMIQKAFQQVMLLQMLPQLSYNTRNGGSDDAQGRQSAQKMALMLAGAFKQSQACGGSNSSDGGIDPMLITLLSQ